jgi:hypothetical protein
MLLLILVVGAAILAATVLLVACGGWHWLSSGRQLSALLQWLYLTLLCGIFHLWLERAAPRLEPFYTWGAWAVVAAALGSFTWAVFSSPKLVTRRNQQRLIRRYPADGLVFPLVASTCATCKTLKPARSKVRLLLAVGPPLSRHQSSYSTVVSAGTASLCLITTAPGSTFAYAPTTDCLSFSSCSRRAWRASTAQRVVR